MLLYSNHCNQENLVLSDTYKKIRCQICGNMIEPYSLERIRRQKVIGEEIREGEIKSLADNILKAAEKKFNIVKDSYIETSDSVLKDLIILTAAFSELYMYKAARNTARLLGVAYIYRGYNRTVRNVVDLAELQRASLWFQASNDPMMEAVTHLLIGRKALQAENCNDSVEYARLLRISIFEFSQAKISEEPLSLKKMDKEYLQLSKEIGFIDEDRARTRDVREMLKAISEYAERNLKVAEQALPQAIHAWGEIQKAQIMSEAIKYHGDIIARSIEEHGELIREGFIELGKSLENGLDKLSISMKQGLDNVAGGLYSISGGLHHTADGLYNVSGSISRSGALMSDRMNSLSKRILIGAGILGGAGLIGLGISSKMLSTSLQSLGNGVSSAIRTGAPVESQLLAYGIDKVGQLK